jgi:protoporphyrinogen oxidase
MIESSAKAGGLASSFVKDGWTWDVGVHVLFSHFEFFDAMLNQLMPPKELAYHNRKSPAWMRDVFVQYPVQNNIWRLPAEETQRIVSDLAAMSVKRQLKQERAAARAAARGAEGAEGGEGGEDGEEEEEEEEVPLDNFLQWMEASFGRELVKSFMGPYNFKVWAHPPATMNRDWVGERVASIDFQGVLGNLVRQQDSAAWGPNALFRFPLNGTGAIWEQVRGTLTTL